MEITNSVLYLISQFLSIVSQFSLNNYSIWMVHYLNGFSMAAPLSPTLSPPLLFTPSSSSNFYCNCSAFSLRARSCYCFPRGAVSLSARPAQHGDCQCSAFAVSECIHMGIRIRIRIHILASFCIPFGFFATLRTFFFWFQFVVSRYTLAEVTFTLYEGILVSLNLIYLPCSFRYTVLIYIYWYTAIMAVIDGVKHFPSMIYSAFCLQFTLNRNLIDRIWYISRMKDYCTKLTSLCQRHLFW